MSEEERKKLGETLWEIANQLRGAMNASSFQDYMLSLIFLRYLSTNYEANVKKELGSDYPVVQLQNSNDKKEKQKTPLQIFYDNNPNDMAEFETTMRRNLQYIIKPEFLWGNMAELARVHDSELLKTLESAFTYIENESFEDSFSGLFSEINLNSDRLGKEYSQRNKKLCDIITKLNHGLNKSSNNADSSADHLADSLGDAYEYLIEKFAANAGQKAGEFYTPQNVSGILSKIVILDNQEPSLGSREKLNRVLDFACGSGSLLLNVNKKFKEERKANIGKIYGQEKNITTYNLARMNMILHGVEQGQFEIFHGDTLTNDWELLREQNPAKKTEFDAIVANPPFSLKWQPTESLADDVRFKSHGLAPKSAADFAFLLHGLYHLKDDGTMAIILPHGVLFRGGVEAKIRTKLLVDENIDTVIGLPANLFYSTGIPVCILVIKKCRKQDDILFMDASTEGNFRKEKRQNHLDEEHVNKIVDTYKNRKEEKKYSRRVTMEEIKGNDYNLNISRYIDTSPEPEIIDLAEQNKKLVELEQEIKDLTENHNKYLKELGLDLLPK